MHIVINPELLPGYCIHCKTKYGRKFMQTDILIENFGTIYICETCIEEIVRAFDGTFPDRLREKDIRIAFLEEENERLRHSLALLDFLPRRSTDGIPSQEGGDSDTEKPAENRAGQKSGPAKSGTSKGSGSVRGSKLSDLLADS